MEVKDIRVANLIRYVDKAEMKEGRTNKHFTNTLKMLIDKNEELVKRLLEVETKPANWPLVACLLVKVMFILGLLTLAGKCTGLL